MHWADCDDEIKMDDFLGQITKVDDLRRFALEVACSFEGEIQEERLHMAISVVEDYLNDMASLERLKEIHSETQQYLEQIEIHELSQPEEDKDMKWEKAALVSWAAVPPDSCIGRSPLEVARQAALHSALYAYRIRGAKELKNQCEILKMIGLPHYHPPEASEQ